MVQIMLLYDSNDPEEVKLAQRLKKGFDKIGCWRCEMPPAGSIYKEMIVYEGDDLKKKEDVK